MKKQKKCILSEQELPTQWYNIQAEMTHKPMLLNYEYKNLIDINRYSIL